MFSVVLHVHGTALATAFSRKTHFDAAIGHPFNKTATCLPLSAR
jgi:hypothetical protein